MARGCAGGFWFLGLGLGGCQLPAAEFFGLRRVRAGVHLLGAGLVLFGAHTLGLVWRDWERDWCCLGPMR